MTVAELIKALQEMPQDREVFLIFDSFAPVRDPEPRAVTFGEAFGDVMEPDVPRDHPIVVID